jgi:hypothetical protein
MLDARSQKSEYGSRKNQRVPIWYSSVKDFFTNKAVKGVFRPSSGFGPPGGEITGTVP